MNGDGRVVIRFNKILKKKKKRKSKQKLKTKVKKRKKGLREVQHFSSGYDTRSADILQDLGWDTLEHRRSKKLAISVFKYLNNLHPEERVETNLQLRFIPTTYEVPRTMFLYLGPVLKLLSGLLAVRGHS